MKNLTLLIFTGSFLMCLAACSTKPDRPEPQDLPEGIFATYIDDDGIKKFQYTIELPDRGKSTRGRGRPGNMSGQMSGSSGGGVSGGVTAGTLGGGTHPTSGASSGYEQVRQLNERLEHMLELELQKNGFCREGYRETERLTEPPVVFIRGECKETASDDDRELFSNDVD
ncbi:hypothetical protein ACFL00_02320 [Pseudomonadota bacterium]